MSRWDEQAFEKIYQDEKFGSLYYVAANNWSLSLIDFQLVRDFSLKNVDVQEEQIVLFLLVLHSLNEGSLCLKLGSEHYYSLLNIFEHAYLDLLFVLKCIGNWVCQALVELLQQNTENRDQLQIYCNARTVH